jgi:ribulose-5-phosphate 4-epimerase/fuculose-1-phosphate aldolase
MSANPAVMTEALPQDHSLAALECEQLLRKQKLAGAFRLLARHGFGLGRAGHVTCRDPIRPDHFWVNPFGRHFSRMRVRDLLLVSDRGEVVEGSGLLNKAAFATHAAVHAARPDIVCAAHAHSTHGKAWSALGRLLDPITQDACAFYRDHAVYAEYGGVVVQRDEGERVAASLGSGKALIMQNHGLLTVGETVDAAIWWLLSLDSCCQVQLLAEAAGAPKVLDDAVAAETGRQIGRPKSGWHNFQPLWEVILEEEPGFLE